MERIVLDFVWSLAIKSTVSCVFSFGTQLAYSLAEHCQSHSSKSNPWEYVTRWGRYCWSAGRMGASWLCPQKSVVLCVTSDFANLRGIFSLFHSFWSSSLMLFQTGAKAVQTTVGAINKKLDNCFSPTVIINSINMVWSVHNVFLCYSCYWK